MRALDGNREHAKVACACAVGYVAFGSDIDFLTQRQVAIRYQLLCAVIFRGYDSPRIRPTKHEVIGIGGGERKEST